MRQLNRSLVAIVVSLGLLVSACGGSADPETPPATTVSVNNLSEADAVANAEAAAADQGFSAEGLEVNAGLLFGEWQVSFEPVNTDSLTGGFLVVLDAQSGELLDIVAYQ